MSRELLIWDRDGFKPAHEVYATRGREAAKHRSDLAAPTVFRDEHWPKGMVCNADGKTYHYKSDYYRAVKAAGCEIMGSRDKLPPRPPPPKKHKLSDAMKRELHARVQALDSPTRKLDERRRKRTG